MRDSGREMRTDANALSQLLRAADEPANPEAQPVPPRVQYRSGRVLTLIDGGGGREESLSVTSPDGTVELTVRFTAGGPVLSFAGARLDLRHEGEVSLSCEELRLHGRRGVELRSEAEVVVRGGGDVSVDGRSVRINCDEGAPYRR